jgi:hypothetical protein
MQLIFVLSDLGEERLTYTVYEKKLPSDTIHSIATSPAIQIGAAFSSFLKTLDDHHSAISEIAISEERRTVFSKGDFRHDLQNDPKIIRLDLKRMRPKGNA